MYSSKIYMYLFQLYVATCAPARDVGGGYVAWGHSTLVGPVSEHILRLCDMEIYKNESSDLRRNSLLHLQRGVSLVVTTTMINYMWQFGEVLATTEHGEAIVISEIDYSQIEQRR